MPHAVLFDTYQYVRNLTKVGVPEPQAEVQAMALVGLIESELTTKRDIAELQAATQRDIAELREATQRDIAELREATQRDIAELRDATHRDIAELREATQRDLKELELRLEVRITESKASVIKWVAGMLLAQSALIATLVKLL